jgi:SAM-dependent methyltransferase
MSFYDVWVKWKDNAIRSLRRHGAVGTLKFSLALVRNRLSCHWRHFGNKLFDRRFAVDTAGTLILPELQYDPRFKYANAYAPTPRSVFHRMLRRLGVDFGRFLFIDFGCGKGKALLLAAELHFKQIIGVELSPKLIRVAEENLKTYCRGTSERDIFQVVCVDAGEYPVPPEPAVYYFANPFQAEVMRKVLESIRQSHAAMPREGYIVYLDPVLQDLLDESGFLAPIKKSALYSIWKVTAALPPTSG